ncbi:phage terminase large subunit family protein [Caballeronia sp. LZ033]|uniref:phage terminase large subunit family protein n=1 Tax=Caballeronia sp. LZ033 TaxID=3038566 RepID=UPI00285C2B2E|nr:terminase gpA endonuclease subunit [Caballeronia sp. LZ033]MDR5815802.1 phage terminase large subunit family protein [Caballeronia sp. LZ033]
MSTNKSHPSVSQKEFSSLDKAALLRRDFRRGWTPPPRVSVPDWADKFRKLAKEAGSTSGDWSTSTVEVARGPMLAVTEPGIHIITAMVSTQMLKTALLENIFGYFAHLDACPILLIQPKDEAAEQFSKERIAPLIRSTPVLRELIASGKTRSSEDTLGYKAFPGGFLALVSAGSPDNLARRPIRVILADEIDKYPPLKEGDSIFIAEERTASFGVNWLSVRACSPTYTDESRIEKSYNDSDQRRVSVACPHCGHRQFLDFFKHVQWDKDKDGRGVTTNHRTKTARIHCECCGAQWSEGERLRALETCRWHQTRPFECCGHRHVPLKNYDIAWQQNDATAVDSVWTWSESDRHAVYYAHCPECGERGIDSEHAGFQASKLYSPWSKDKPSDIAAKWIAAQGDEEQLQAWWNTQMGMPYKRHVGKGLSADALAARTEVWAAEVPEGVGILTAGLDTQDDRIEVEVIGWGRNEESWSIDHSVFEGDPEGPEIWRRVDAYLKRVWTRSDGRGFVVSAACIDSGGHHTQKVYEFAKARLGRKIWAIRGEPARNGKRSPIWPTKRPSARNRSAFTPITIGVNAAKDVIRDRLRGEPEESFGTYTYPPGYMHFPSDRDINYFGQLIAERLITKTSGGQTYRVWELPRGKANEALDCRVYGYAALCGLLHMGLKLNRRVESVQADLSDLEPATPAAREEVELDVVTATRPARPDGPVIKQAQPEKRSRIRRLAG